jgi:hypothetical protein
MTANKELDGLFHREGVPRRLPQMKVNMAVTAESAEELLQKPVFLIRHESYRHREAGNIRGAGEE